MRTQMVNTLRGVSATKKAENAEKEIKVAARTNYKPKDNNNNNNHTVV